MQRRLQVETLATGADSRGSWQRARHCIIPALGFYEWHVNPDATEQPYYIHPDDHDVFGFAGLWARSNADANAVTECCSLITLPAYAVSDRINSPHSNDETLLEPLETDVD